MPRISAKLLTEDVCSLVLACTGEEVGFPAVRTVDLSIGIGAPENCWVSVWTPSSETPEYTISSNPHEDDYHKWPVVAGLIDALLNRIAMLAIREIERMP